jgi:hypothetical protein
MYRSENAHDQIERDPRNDPRGSGRDPEKVVERKSIVADRSREEGWPSVPVDRRRGERRRIERTGTDI